MGAFFVYILKSSFCLALFYLFYRLLLSRDTFHRFNRLALLSLLVLSCVVPLIEVTSGSVSEVNQPFLSLEDLLLMASMNGQIEAEQAGRGSVGWRDVLFLVYIIGVCFFILRSVWSLFQLRSLIRKSTVSTGVDGIRIARHNEKTAPFSWLNYIVISEEDLQENGREILTHERAHIRLRHSVDLLIADICIFLQWFNPAAWLLKRELQNIHEYEADESVIKEGIDAKHYQLLLIKKAVGTRLYSMANSLNHSSIKKRITMMLQKKSSPWARAKYLYVLPLAAVAIAAFARPEVSNELNELSEAKVTNLSAITKADEVKSSKNMENPPQTPEKQVLQVAEKMPEYPGGMAELMKFISTTVQYPKESHENGEQGRVIVQFVVEKDGTVTNPKVLKSVTPALDAEALRVVKLMPKWKPGMNKGKAVAVKFSVPISFRLDGGSLKPAEGKSVSESSADEKPDFDIKKVSYLEVDAPNPAKKPLVIVDGKRVGNEIPSTIPANMISEVQILKGGEDLAKFGEAGKNGVVLITTREAKK